MKVTQISNLVSKSDLEIRELSCVPVAEKMTGFALNVIDDHIVFLTGGLYDWESSNSALALDLNSGDWLYESTYPRLNTGRYCHSSCTTDSAVFVFGGFHIGTRALKTIERMSIHHETYSDGSVKTRRWDQFTMQSSDPLTNCLMATLDNSSILVLGGINGQQKRQSHGFVLDAETLKEKYELPLSDVPF